MDGRKQLRGIVSDLAKSFASRNFDVGGYWAVGRLYAPAIQSGTREIALDLACAAEAETSPSLIEAARRHCASKLEQQFAKRLLPRRKDYGCGQPYECRVEVVDDLGRRYCGTSRGKVEPRDPSTESGRKHCDHGRVISAAAENPENPH